MKSESWLTVFAAKHFPPYHPTLDRDRSRNFFLVTLGLAALLWGLYALLYFMTLDATSGGILVTLAGLSGIFAILLSAAAVIGFIVWMVALGQGW